MILWQSKGKGRQRVFPTKVKLSFEAAERYCKDIHMELFQVNAMATMATMAFRMNDKNWFNHEKYFKVFSGVQGWIDDKFHSCKLVFKLKEKHCISTCIFIFNLSRLGKKCSKLAKDM